MFESYKGSREEEMRGDIERLSDEKLLEAYRANQENAKHPFIVGSKEKELKFAYVGFLRDEIEKRGLAAPTMKEREELGDL